MFGFLKDLFRWPQKQPYWTPPENPDYDEIIEVLDEVLKYLSSPACDVAWSSFSSPEDAKEAVSVLAERIKVHDSSAITELIYLFLPTGDLQEISISSGWGDRFIALSMRFDKAIGEPT